MMQLTTAQQAQLAQESLQMKINKKRIMSSKKHPGAGDQSR